MTRVALVTGGSRGIGRASAEALARGGCTVAVGDIREAEPVGEGERDHHRVEIMEAITAAPQHGQRQVQFRRRETDQRGEPRKRVTHDGRLLNRPLPAAGQAPR